MNERVRVGREIDYAAPRLCSDCSLETNYKEDYGVCTEVVLVLELWTQPGINNEEVKMGGASARLA